MALAALATSPAHPLYLYVVFAVCVIAAIALLIGATISRRNSSWRRQMQLQATTTRRSEPAYPIEPAKTAPVAEAADAGETGNAELVTVAAAKKPAPRKTTATAAKKTATGKKTAAKKTTAKKT
jgi:Tfp pilus assembly protein PilV